MQYWGFAVTLTYTGFWSSTISATFNGSANLAFWMHSGAHAALGPARFDGRSLDPHHGLPRRAVGPLGRRLRAPVDLDRR